MGDLLKTLPAALAALALAATGCGDESSVRVMAPKTVQRQDVARYPPGSPERSTLELLRAVQLNDPVAAVRYVAPAFGLSRAQLVRTLDDVRAPALALSVPRRLTVRSRGRSVASVVTRLRNDRITLRWTRAAAGWRLTGLGARSDALARPITSAIFLARHPEQSLSVPLRERALIDEWYSILARIRKLGR